MWLVAHIGGEEKCIYGFFFVGRKSKRPPGRPRSRHDNAELNITGI